MCGADLSDLDECESENRNDKSKDDGAKKKAERGHRNKY